MKRFDISLMDALCVAHEGIQPFPEDDAPFCLSWHDVKWES
jgi:hypothetical protein